MESDDIVDCQHSANHAGASESPLRVIKSWFKWIAESARPRKRMGAEVRFNLESYAADLVRNRVPEQEAMRLARIRFGWAFSKRLSSRLLGKKYLRRSCRKLEEKTRERLSKELTAPAFSSAMWLAI